MNALVTHTDRRLWLGGSDAPVILGVSPWKTALELYMEKTGQAAPDEPDAAQLRRFARGKAFEPIITTLVVDELRGRGHDVEVLATGQRYADEALPYLAAEIDVELLVDGEPVNGEIKSVHPFAAKSWGEPGSDEIPLAYFAQVMHGLSVRPRPRALVAALIGTDDLRIHWVQADAEIIANMREREREFWQRIQDRNPPEAATVGDALLLHPRDDGTAIEADAEILQTFNALREAKALAKEADAAIDAMSDRLRLFMGAATTLTSGGKVLATWKAQQASRLDVTALKAAEPALAALYTKTTESRVLRLK